MRKIDAVRRYPEDMTPEGMIEFEVTDSIKKIVKIRDVGEKEENQLRAAKYILDKFLPDRIQAGGDFVLRIVSDNEKED